MKDETILESASSSLTLNSAATIVASMAGGPVAALLPLLVNTLANKRHKARVEAALEEIQNNLSSMGNKINNITDSQYKFINESVITILNSPDNEKINYLKKGIENSVASERLNLHEAGLISRILRDITVEELTFLIECNNKKIVFNENKEKDFINISKTTQDGERATGLIALGLLTKEQGEGTWDDDGAYIFTPISNKLVELII